MVKRKRASTAVAPFQRQEKTVPVIAYDPVLSNALKGVNDLTRFASTPGYLQYEGYRRLLVGLGHTKQAPPDHKGPIPATPQNCSLQLQRGDRTDDCTDFRADQALWTQDDVPNVMYALNKPQNWLSRDHLKDPPLKQYPIRGKILRDIPVLPDHISIKVEGWRLAVWYRMDPRIKLSDIGDRIETDKKNISSTINMRTLRFREWFPALGWVNPGAGFRRHKREIEHSIRNAGIPLALNTTRGISWGLKDPARGEQGGRINIPEGKRNKSTVEATPAQFIALPSSLPQLPPMTQFPSKPAATASSAARNDEPRVPISGNQPASSRRMYQPTEPNDFTPGFEPLAANLNYILIRDEQPELTTAMYPQILPIPDHSQDSEEVPIQYHLPQPIQDANPSQYIHYGFVPSEDYNVLRPIYQWEVQDTIPGSPEAVSGILRFGGIAYRLRTIEERHNLPLDAHHLLDHYFVSGSAERTEQLEYLLDPFLAQFGFSDRNGYLYGHGSPWVLPEDGNITYRLTLQEGMARLNLKPEDVAGGVMELLESRLKDNVGDLQGDAGT